MTYMNNFIAVVKCGGRIMRDQYSTIFMPFGSEYSLYFKNQESRKALVHVTIDGEDVMSGKKIIVEPNSTAELNGFLNDDNTIRNKFKFIQKTKQISDYRGDRVDDGLIRIEVWFERKVEVRPVKKYEPIWPHFVGPYWVETNFDNHLDPYGGIYNTRIGCSVDNLTRGKGYSSGSVYNSCVNNIESFTAPNVDEGLTVKGSQTYEQYNYGHIGCLEPTSTVITFQLKGASGKGKVTRPVTVKTKLVCETCGTKNRSGKFCKNCGTSLI